MTPAVFPIRSPRSVIAELMEFMARQPVEGTVRAMFLQELQFDGVDTQGDHVG